MHLFPKSLFLLTVLLFFMSCGNNETAVKPESANKPDQVSLNTKDQDIPSGKYKDMYCITNNVIVYSSHPADNTAVFFDPASFADNSDPERSRRVPEQMMKYDRVRMYDVKGNWARVELETSHKDAQKAQKETGWVSRNTLDEWKTDKFFNVKDNVFQARKEIKLYGKPISDDEINRSPGFDKLSHRDTVPEPVEGTLTTNDTYRVLKGEDDSFYVVSKSGTAGWVHYSNIDTSKLVAKGVSITEQRTFPEPAEMIDGKKVVFSVQGDVSVDPNLAKGDLDKVFLLAGGTKEGTLLKRYGKIMSFTESFGTRFYEETGGNYFQLPKTNIGKDTYYKDMAWNLNLFGTMAIMELYIPEEVYKDWLNFQNETVDTGENLAYQDYFQRYHKKYIKKEINNIYRLRLFKRDAGMKLIKELVLKGRFDMVTALKVGTYNQYEINEKYIIITLKPYHEMVFDWSHALTPMDKYISGNPGLTLTNIAIKISDRELQATGTSVAEIKREYENWYVAYQNNSGNTETAMESELSYINMKMGIGPDSKLLFNRDIINKVSMPRNVAAVVIKGYNSKRILLRLSLFGKKYQYLTIDGVNYEF